MSAPGPKRRRCPECGHPNRPYEVETCTKCGYVFLWRRLFGRKGFNRVAVYERERSGPLQIMWWDRGGPHRETLTNLAGVPIEDKAKAERIGRRVSDGQAKKRKQSRSLDELLGLPERHTVGELFARIHQDKHRGWSEKWATDWSRYRRFWERELGKATDLTAVGPADVRAKVDDAAHANGWSPKTQNHYLNAAVEAWSYAEEQLKWIRAEDNLVAVKRHRVPVDNTEIAYSTDEAHAVLEELPEIDLRAAVVGELSYIGGRRLAAIMGLGIDTYRTEARIVRTPRGAEPMEFGVVTFPAKTDKARKRGEVYLYGRPKELVERLIAKPLCQASGLLIPRGDDLEASEAVELPQTDKKLRGALRKAEKAAGVQRVRGRSFHAFNRTFSTDAEDLTAASAQSGKTEETMRRIYRQPKPAEKAALAIQIDSLRRGA